MGTQKIGEGMAIQFARIEYVSRSEGRNACMKATYNARSQMTCERTGQVFNFTRKTDNVQHEILLPEGVDTRFKDAAVLWNAIEISEKRKDSQLQKDCVVALPGDPEITLEDKIEISRRIAERLFVSKGLAVQCDIHAPHEGEKNWHVHMLATTRGFTSDGKSLSPLKARDTDPLIRKGIVMEADSPGEISAQIQNAYFEEKGLSLRVDPIGILPQEHLGPVRMRHHLNDARIRAQMLKEANEELAQNPLNILEELTKHQSVFSKKEIAAFIEKHVPYEKRGDLLESTLNHHQILPLYDPETEKPLGLFTTQKVREEEEKTLRFADQIASNKHKALRQAAAEIALEGKKLTSEQRAAFDGCVREGNPCLIQGRAGVGKSYVLDPIRRAHEESGYRVLGLAPTHKVATDLGKDGFREAKTCHAFLFALRNNRETLDRKTAVIVDEAGMLGTELSLELFHAIKKSGAKLILVGDERQLASVERGGMFGLLAERYGSVDITEVRRQKVDWQKQVSEDLSKGQVKEAVGLLEKHQAISWNSTKEEALSSILNRWARDIAVSPHASHLILAQRNIDVDALNQGVRDILRQQGQLGGIDYECLTQRGRVSFAEGDRIHFTKTAKDQGIINGWFGTIKAINPDSKVFTIQLDHQDGKQITIDPSFYDGLRHGYASTVYKAQGSTLDHTYVLHSGVSNSRVNYVALTRQTKSLSLYVSKEETFSERHLIQQMSREEGKGPSLIYATLKDIEKRKQREEDKSMSLKVKDTVETALTSIKDRFHKNNDFYSYTPPKESEKQHAIIKQTPLNINSLETLKDKGKDNNKKQEEIKPRPQDKSHLADRIDSPQKDKNGVKDMFVIKGLSYVDLTQKCMHRLLEGYERKYHHQPSSQKLAFLKTQAERTADYLYHTHTIQGKNPSHQEVKNYSKIARYTIERLPKLRDSLIQEMKEQDKFEKSDILRAHLKSERLVAIEGRILLTALREGKQFPPNYNELALKEFNRHQKEKDNLAKDINHQYSLSRPDSIRLANEILRHKQKYDKSPSAHHKKAMLGIVKYLEKREQDFSKAGGRFNKNEIDFIRRKEADRLLNYIRKDGSFPDRQALEDIQKSAEKECRHLMKELSRNLSKGFSR